MNKVYLGLGVLFCTNYCVAAESVEIDPILVKEEKSTNKVELENISNTKLSADTVKLLELNPSISFQKAGGLSSLPIIHGMASDRVNIKIDGGQITSSCPNHMNPALSYLDPSKVSEMELIAGVTPVSQGGDSIGGSIIVATKKPDFAEEGKIKHKANITESFKSNNQTYSTSLSYEFSKSDIAFSYLGNEEKAKNYKRGNGDELKATRYNQNNQAITLSKKINDGLMSLKVNHTIVPYEGFANQYMDLLDNTGTGVNLNYLQGFGNVIVDAAVFHQHVEHYMNILHPDRTGDMPMYTRSDETGYNVKLDYEVNGSTKLKFGNELALYRLDDWWPPVAGSMMMSPDTFKNINNGKRDRIGFFAEVDKKWSEKYKTNFGVRADIVKMDTGDVQGYNGTNNSPNDEAYFNSRNREKTDHNIDATFTNEFILTESLTMQVGLARKTRSPNLYERYAWAGSVQEGAGGSGMDMTMINWFGDGNGYVGDIDLKPEVAHTLSTSFIYTDRKKEKWKLSFSPYYSEVKDFIDVDYLGYNSMRNLNYLKFANHDAVIFGFDLGGDYKFNNRFSLKMVGNYTRGYRKDGESDLYQLMPLNAKINLIYTSGKWTSDFMTYLVDKKENTSKLRLEEKTSGYALFDLGTSYQATNKLRLDLRVTNLLDKDYEEALGGVDLANSSTGERNWMAGMGRSLNFSLSYDL